MLFVAGHRGEAEAADLCESEASLIYKANFRTARACYREFLARETKQTNKPTNKKEEERSLNTISFPTISPDKHSLSGECVKWDVDTGTCYLIAAAPATDDCPAIWLALFTSGWYHLECFILAH